MSGGGRNGRARFDGWALSLPDDGGGSRPRLVVTTFAVTRDECWSLSFGWLTGKLGEEWREQYWKRWSEGMADARRRGYRMVRVYLQSMETQR